MQRKCIEVGSRYSLLTFLSLTGMRISFPDKKTMSIREYGMRFSREIVGIEIKTGIIHIDFLEEENECGV